MKIKSPSKVVLKAKNDQCTMHIHVLYLFLSQKKRKEKFQVIADYHKIDKTAPTIRVWVLVLLADTSQTNPIA